MVTTLIDHVSQQEGTRWPVQNVVVDSSILSGSTSKTSEIKQFLLPPTPLPPALRP